MWRPRRSHSIGRLRLWLLGLALIVALVAIGVLTYQAIGLDRSHRAVAAGVLQDYSAFASDQFSRIASDRIKSLMTTILEPVACGSSLDARRAAAERTARDAMTVASCANPTTIDGFFEIEPATGRVAFATGSLANRVSEIVTSIKSQSSFGFDLLPAAGSARVLAYLQETGESGQKRVVGFVAPASILEPVFAEIVRQERLLPGSLTAPVQNREYLTIDVRDGDGASIFRAGDGAATFVSERRVFAPDGNLHVRLGINAAAAGRLIIGGVPRSRLPLLLSLLAITAALLTVGAWQMHREHRLAQMRVDFVRSASHELRTPLAQIRLFTETLQLGRVRSWSEVRQSLAFVDQQTRRLSRLVENLLTFAHGRQRRQGDFGRIELGAFLSDTCSAFQPIAEAAGQKVRLDKVEPCVVRADREWLTQVVLNLLDNATKYGPSGQSVTISVINDNNRAAIAVEDQGPGIPPNDRQRIFAPFVRLAREHEERTGGTGIGLAVAADLMAAMDGRIWADEATRGARFIVELPAVRETTVEPLADKPTPLHTSDEARTQVA